MKNTNDGRQRRSRTTPALVAGAGIVLAGATAGPADLASAAQTDAAQPSPALIMSAAPLRVGSVTSRGLLAGDTTGTPTDTLVVSAQNRGALRSALGARFGGAWNLPLAGGHVAVVAVTNPTSADAVMAAQLLGQTNGAKVRVVNSARSLITLEAMADQVKALTISGSFGVGVNEPVGTLEIILGSTIAQQTPAVASALTALMADPSVMIRQNTPITAINSGYPDPNRGSVRMWTSPPNAANASNACTTGFGMRTYPPGQVLTYTLSAAHCTPWGPGSRIFSSGADNAGPIQPYSQVIGFNTSQDAIAFSSTNDGFLYRAPNSFYSVTGQAEPVWFEQSMCFRGASTTVERCGGVSRVNFTFTLDTPGIAVQNGFCIGAVAQGGDSGSAIYQLAGGNNVTAKGSVSGILPGEACGPTISNMLSGFGGQLITAAPGGSGK